MELRKMNDFQLCISGSALRKGIDARAIATASMK